MLVLYIYGKDIVLTLMTQSQNPSHRTDHESIFKLFLFTEDMGMESGFVVYLGEHSAFLICHSDDRTNPQTKTLRAQLCLLWLDNQTLLDIKAMLQTQGSLHNLCNYLHSHTALRTCNL